MKIGIITYDRPHRKTQDVLHGLHEIGYKKIKLIVSKFRKFKNKKIKNFFEHRPDQFNGPSIKEISGYYDLSVCNLDDKNIYRNLDIVLICGSAIINNSLIKKNFVINCHSGLIPLTRGLDAFKWAILEKKLIGTTLHYIDENVDLGKIISHEKTPFFKSDTIKRFAKRHYNAEVNMLTNFEYHLNNPKILNLETCQANMRMPINLEKKMYKMYNNYKRYILK